MNKIINKKLLIIFLLLLFISIFYYLLIVKKNKFFTLNNLQNNNFTHIPKILQGQPKSESTKEENLQILNKYSHLLRFIEKIYIKYQNKIKKIDKELNLYQKDYLILHKELRHYKNLEKSFHNKIVRIAKELDWKKQILIENKIYSFKKSSLMIEEQQLQELKQKNDDMKKIIQAKKDQIKQTKIKTIELAKSKNIYHETLYDLSGYPKSQILSKLTHHQPLINTRKLRTIPEESIIN
ncbi:effector ['Opuntia sp.' phytoplasma]|uniref:Effector n=1 Tax=Candidatus Phytoplasma asiaticum TaxID=2763338 RepID=A0AAX3B9S1_9MOLU|nr:MULTISPECIES: effector [Phytoplasma]MDO8054055.1 effector ['Opuntia sp.' phytoplasma]MDO8057830.1 effector ['Opuntia sp.' phytoplasma]UQV27437.1 effector ['Parthenium hysterophorus' phyllody phytoplasma]